MSSSFNKKFKYELEKRALRHALKSTFKGVHEGEKEVLSILDKALSSFRFVSTSVNSCNDIALNRDGKRKLSDRERAEGLIVYRKLKCKEISKELAELYKLCDSSAGYELVDMKEMMLFEECIRIEFTQCALCLVDKWDVIMNVLDYRVDESVIDDLIEKIVNDILDVEKEVSSSGRGDKVGDSASSRKRSRENDPSSSFDKKVKLENVLPPLVEQVTINDR